MLHEKNKYFQAYIAGYCPYELWSSSVFQFMKQFGHRIEHLQIDQ